MNRIRDKGTAFHHTDEQKQKVSRILHDLGLDKDDHVYLVDARNDNKPSGSNA